MGRMRTGSGLVAVATLLTGCGLLTGPEAVIGRVAAVDAPDTVRAGEAFTVTVQTVGSNGCWRADRTEVDLGALRAVVTPYDVEDRESDEACTMALVDIIHEATLTFERAGTAEVVVRGRDGTGADRSIVVED